jgi:hypothetical protein
LKAVGDDSTESPGYHGAARQTFGSSAIRHPDDNKKIHKEKEEKLRDRNLRYHQATFDDPSSQGVLVIAPPTPHTRYTGPKVPITHTRINTDGIQFGSERRDITMFEQMGHSGHTNMFLGNHQIFDEDPMNSNHQSSGSPGECDTQCESMEFFCSKSCSCIHADLHCGKFS